MLDLFGFTFKAFVILPSQKDIVCESLTRKEYSRMLLTILNCSSLWFETWTLLHFSNSMTSVGSWYTYICLKDNNWVSVITNHRYRQSFKCRDCFWTHPSNIGFTSSQFLFFSIWNESLLFSKFWWRLSTDEVTKGELFWLIEVNVLALFDSLCCLKFSS